MFKRVQDGTRQFLQFITAKLRQLVPVKPPPQDNQQNMDPHSQQATLRLQEYDRKLNQINRDFPQRSTEIAEAQKTATEEVKNKIFVNQILNISINADLKSRNKEILKQKQKGPKPPI